MKDIKIVVASSPHTDTGAPIMAPALFKGILTKAGFNCVGIDLNIIADRFIQNSSNKSELLQFLYYENMSPGIETQVKNLFDMLSDKILQHNPTLVCLSLLHYQCQVSTKWLCFCIKKINPNIKIVIGGAGAFGSGLTTNEQNFISLLHDRGLIDYYISGDGDNALVELAKGNTSYPGINSMTWQPIEDLNSIAYPVYDDYDFSLYKTPFVGVLGSRGCVRQCTFCDIHEYWEKFKWRSGENIFDEMLYQNKKYNTRYFKFQDSLINGNVKEYNKLIKLLADHNNANPDNRLHWASYFIFRPQSQMSEEQWKLTAESGAVILNVGIESLVDKNRMHMKKKFSNKDIEYSLQMCKKYKLNLTFLIIIGYVTETEQDHLDTLEWLEKNAHYANDPIKVISIGGTLSILPGTWLDRNQKMLGVEWKNDSTLPVSGKNHLWRIESTNNNYETRLRRFNEFLQVGTRLGYRVEYSVIDPQKELENEVGRHMISHD